MGKQINYWLDYDGFLKIAETALQKGCEILKKENGKVIRGNDISLITPNCFDYFFHYPPAGEVKIGAFEDGREYVDSGYTPSGNTLIEAGFSRISYDAKTISRARLFVISGYYDKNDEWVPRPDCMTKLFSSLERVAKKVAPRNVETFEYVTPNGEKTVRKYVFYVSPVCAQFIEKYQIKKY
ncbi:MAG: hypothetical protein HDT28_03130 [Clostridiales bacterium]|nr:hypothetical protein [Clostridiales bacterium]